MITFSLITARNIRICDSYLIKSILKINSGPYDAIYDIYSINPHNFGFVETSDFENFKDLGHFNEGKMKTTNFTSPKHGAVIQLTRAEAQKLAQHWEYTLNFE